MGMDVRLLTGREINYQTPYHAPEWIHVLCVLVVYCCITKYHKCSDLKQNKTLSHKFSKVRSPDTNSLGPLLRVSPG